MESSERLPVAAEGYRINKEPHGRPSSRGHTEVRRSTEASVTSIWCDPLTWRLALMQASLEAERTRTGQDLSVSVLTGHTSVRAAASTSPPPASRSRKKNPENSPEPAFTPSFPFSQSRSRSEGSHVGTRTWGQNQGEDVSQKSDEISVLVRQANPSHPTCHINWFRSAEADQQHFLDVNFGL